jgi:cyclopropane fatty-acyl-phospholipid synthase-like methyltransferase
MWLICCALIMAILFSAGYAGFSAAPWVPTLSRDKKQLLSQLQLKPGEKVVDLGCGDGSLLFAVAKRFPDAIYTGYDISLLPLFLGKMRRIIFRSTYKNVRVKFGNLFKKSLKDFDVVFVFLLPKCYPKLLKRLKTEVREDAVVIVEAWPLPGVPILKSLKEPGCLSLYFYTGKAIRSVD